MDKQLIVSSIRDRMSRWYELEDPLGERGPIGAYCLQWAVHTVDVLKEYGIQSQIQAGSAYWPRLRPEQDDGLPSTMTHFGYKFGSDEPWLRVGLPEIHCWVGILPNIIVDVTTSYWPELAALRGIDWPGDLPPHFFWGTADECPEGVVYQASFDAIKLAYSILKAR